MSPDKIISQLAKDLKPVKVLKYNTKDYLLVFAAGVFSVLASIAIAGLRLDLSQIISSPRFILETIVLIGLAILSTLAAFHLSIPSTNSHFSSRIVIFNLFAWLGFLLYFLIATPEASAGWGISCAKEVTIDTLIPAIVLFLIIKRGASLNRAASGWLVLTSAAAYGALATQFTCSSDDPLHILVWHALPVIILGFLGVALGKFLIKKL